MYLSRSFVTCHLCAILIITSIHANAQSSSSDDPSVIVGETSRAEESGVKRYVGVVDAVQHVDIVPRVTGTLQKVLFREGEIVKKGDILYQLEDTTYRAKVDILKAQKTQLEAALTFADLEYKRSTRLLESNAVAVSAHDKAKLDIDSAKARINEIAAQLVDAENTLSYTKIHAPLTGRVGKSRFSEGNLLVPGSGILCSIEMTAPIYVKFSLSEPVFRKDLGGLAKAKEDARVRIVLADGEPYSETAKITLIDNKINSATDSITLWAEFQNADNQLIPGSYVTVLVSVRPEKPYVAIVPSALVVEDEGMCVYVVDGNNIAERRVVTTGGNTDDGLIVITSGLNGDERIVVEGTHKVVPGKKVVPVIAEESK